MAIGRPIPVLTLSDDERDTLERWARRPTTAQALAQRARLVLTCASGRTNTQVAHELRLTKQTVGKWRSRFLTARLDGLPRVPARRGASVMRKWSRWCRSRWRQNRAKRPIGARARWRRAVG